MKYFLAPRSGEKSYSNFQSSIRHGVPYDRIGRYLAEEGKSILSHEPIIYAWGNRTGKRKAWEKMEKGDLIIFYAKYNFVLAGKLIYKQHSSEMAKAMWPPDEKGNPWEYTFFLNGLQYFRIPLSFFNDISGYKFKSVQGFQEIRESSVRQILSKYKDFSELFNKFNDENSLEIPKIYEPVNLNINREVKPEFISNFKLQPYTEEEKTYIPLNKAKPVDFEDMHKKNSKTGSLGEEIVLKYEKDYLTKAGREALAGKVSRVSIEDMNLGYDILSFDKAGNQKFIEVKSTTLPKRKKFSFNISVNEKNVAENAGEDYYVYLVFEVDKEKPKIVTIRNPFSLGMLRIEPTNFRIKGISI